MYVCFCNGVTADDIHAVVMGGAGTATEVVERSGASARCGGCRGTLARLLTVYGIAADDRPWGGDEPGCPSAATCPRLQGHDPGDCPTSALQS